MSRIHTGLHIDVCVATYKRHCSYIFQLNILFGIEHISVLWRQFDWSYLSQFSFSQSKGRCCLSKIYSVQNVFISCIFIYTSLHS